ncbi:MAG: hypothetical protein LUD15_13650 [Bacteroides sp.]|nr:hypothetical protein [Bacteroides sp.]
MKTLFSYRRWIPLLIIGSISVSSLLTGCDDTSEEETEVRANFESYSPTSGSKGTMLTLKVEYSGLKIKDIQVWVNNVETDVINVTHSQINARVPAGAGSGPVRVVVGNFEHTYPTSFEFLPNYMVSNYAGSGEVGYMDVAALSTRFQNLYWLAYDAKEDVIYTLETDIEPQRMRRIRNGMIETVVDFTRQAVRMNNPRTIEFSVTGDTIFVENDNGNNPAENPYAVGILTRADDFKVVKPYITYPAAITEHVNYAGVHPVDGTLIYYCWPSKLYVWDNEAQKATLLADIQQVIGQNGSYGSVQFSPDGKTIYLILQQPYQGILSAEYDAASKSLTKGFSRFAGTGSWGSNDGQGVEAGMDQPSQGAFAQDGNLYTVERFNHIVRRITPSGAVSLFAGTPGAGYTNGEATEAKFNQPLGFTIDKNNTVFVAEFANHRIRMIKEE